MKNVLKKIRRANGKYWDNLLDKEKILTFKNACKKVPAYKKFLDLNGWNGKIKKIRDFETLPIESKANYLKKYPLCELSLDGSLAKPLILTSTSGSTGDPFYFPRTEQIDEEYSYILERFISEGGPTKNEPTLMLICFGMGVWIGGVITYQAMEMASRRSNLPVSILAPGINKSEIIKALKLIAPNYKNIIIVGYPPFIKDVVDEAISEKIDFSKYNVRYIFAAEIFTESFRDYICNKTFVKNIYKDTLSIYGSADIGAMAWETGALILLKRLLQKEENKFEQFFGKNHAVPTIGYFNPAWLQFEEKDGEILITGENAIPFVRYSIGDHGGTFSFNQMIERLKSLGIDFYKEAEKAGLKDSLIKLPCVYVYERKDLSTTLYGLQIYPEIIRESIFNDSFHEYLTGKFSMKTKFDDKQDQYLEIAIETKKEVGEVPAEKQNEILAKIVENLNNKSSEFQELAKHLGVRANPKLVFLENENEYYFKPGIKQKWIQK